MKRGNKQKYVFFIDSLSVFQKHSKLERKERKKHSKRKEGKKKTFKEDETVRN